MTQKTTDPLGDGFDAAIDAAGSRAELARLIGVTKEAVYKWDRKIPLSRVKIVEKVTGVSMKILRPDLFE